MGATVGAILRGRVPLREVWVVRSLTGVSEIYSACKTLPLVYRSSQRLSEYVATAEEYIVIQTSKGHPRILRGPLCYVENPFEDLKVEVHKMLRVRHGEAIYVYADHGDGDDVEGRVVVGPCTYMPRSTGDSVHLFAWTGTESRVPNVKIGTQHIDVNIPSAVGCDGSQLSLRMFYSIRSLEVAVSSCVDPPGEMATMLAADVSAYYLCTPAEDQSVRKLLCDLSRLRLLTRCAQRVGMRVESVVLVSSTTENFNPLCQNARDVAGAESRIRIMQIYASAEEKRLDEMCERMLSRRRKCADLELDCAARSHDQAIALATRTQDLQILRIKRLKELDPNLRVSDVAPESHCEVATHPNEAPLYWKTCAESLEDADTKWYDLKIE